MYKNLKNNVKEESSRFDSAKSQRVEYYHKKLWQKMTAWLCVSVLVFQPLMVSAGVVVDKAAAANNRPTLDRAANGVGIVNVARPNDKGVSHNVFTEFNVNKDGLILNNSRVITNTQLGGHIAGNANFGEANARLILNEVTGRNRSDLRGHTEVAGQAADYVLANPYGITCDGCGFINTPRVTLAAGVPELHNGQLRSFNVDNGSFIVQGMGLNASNVQHLDIIARSAQINAQLHAQKLTMALGKNNVDYTTGRATSLLKEDEDSDAPEFALDVAALGGMYVNAISMMGTERGVGVRVAGDMAAATGDLTLTADGKISINKASAKERIAISSFSNDVDITNNLHANIIDVTAAETLTINGDITSGLSEVDIRAKNIITDTKILTGFDNNGHYQKDGLFLAVAQNSWINSGDVLSTGSINVTTHHLLNSPGALLQADNNLFLRAASVLNQSAIIAAGKELHLSVADYFDNSQGAVFSDSHNINLSARDFNNTAGRISAGGDVHVEISKELNNAAGNISAGAGVVIEGEGALVNAGGNIVSSDSQLNLQGIFDNQNSSYVRDDADLVLNLGGLDNRDGYIFHSGTGVFDLNISGIFDNRSGQFGSDGSLDVAAQSLLNDDGILYGKKLLNLQITQDISNLRGYLSSDGELSVYSQRLNNNNGKIFQAGTGQLEIFATLIENNFGQIASNTTLQLTHDLLTNHEGSLTAESIIIRGESLDNSNGTIDADMLDIELTGNLLNDGDAHLVAQGSGDNSLAISVEGLLSNGGLIGTNAQTARIAAGDFNNSGRLLHAGEGVFQLDVLGQLINSNRMDSNGNFLIHTDSLQNSHLIFGAELGIQADAGLDNRDGTLESQTAINVAAESLDNSGGVILASGADDNEIVIEKMLENSSGIIQTNANNLVISAEEIRNNNGKLLHAGSNQLFVSADRLENNNGQIASNNALAVNIADVNNRGGNIGAATINLTGTHLDNSAGIINADRLQINLAGNLLNDAQGQLIALGTEIDALLLNIQGLLDNQGYIGTNAQQASIHANSMINSGYLLHAGFGVLRINVSESLHNTGTLESGGNIIADAQTLQNSNTLVSSADMTLSAVKIINSHTFDSSGAINITATDFDNRGGSLTAAGTGESQITIANELNNQAGVIQTNADQFVITANQINNDAGNILHAGNGVLQISADHLSNHTGAIASNRQMQIIAQDINNNSGSLTAAQINITGNNLNNSGGSIDADQLQILLTGNLLNLTTATNAYISALDTAPGSLILRADGQLENSGVIQTNAESGSISAGNFINTGHVLHAGTGVLRLEAQTGFLNNSRIDSNGDQHIFADDLTNQGFITSVGDLDITVQQALNNSGDLDAGGAIVIAASDLDNTNGFITGAGTADSAINLSGLLINNNGVIQSNATNFSITAYQLDNTNKAAIKHAGAGQLDINVADTLVNTDAQITANAKIITNTDSFDNREGKISAQTILIDAHHLDNSGGTLDSDRLQIELSGNLTNNIGAHNNLEGLITALGINPDDLWLNVAGSLENYGIIQTRAQSAYIAADSLNNQNSIYHVGVGVLRLDVKNTLTNSGTLESNGQLSVDADTLVNANGLVASTDILDLAIESLLNNSFGHIDSGEAIKVRAGEFVNQQGYVVSAGTGNLDWSVIGSLDNTDGIIESNADVMSLTANQLHNEAGRITHAGSGQLDINATESINNKSGIMESTAAIKLVSQNIDNQQGDIFANNISAIGEVLNNTDGVIGADKLTLQLTRLDNIKTAASQRGIISALGADANSLIINVAGGVNNSGVIQTNAQSGELNAKAITNTGEIIHAGLGVLRLKSDGTFTNNAGKLISLGALDLNLGSLVNTNGGAIVADKSLALKAQTGITNDAAQIGSAQALIINVVAGNLINRNAAKILSNGGNSLIHVSGNLNNQNGIIGVEGTKSSISVGSSLNNRAGIIKHLGSGELSVKAGSIDNSGGDLLGDDRLLLTQFNQLINNLLNGKAGNIAASHISIAGTTLNNTDGEIFASGTNSLDINVDTINNTRGDLYSLGDVTIDAKTINNTNGTIQSEKTLTLNLPSFNLSNGLFNAANSLVINTTGNLTNGVGNKLLTSGNLSLNTTGSITNYGTLSALGDLGLKGAGLINGRSDIAAVVSAGNFLNLNFTGAISNYGQLSGANGFTLFSQTLNNHSGALVSGGNLTATVSGNLNNYALMFAADNLNLFTANQMNNYTQANVFSLNNIIIARNSSLAANTQVLNQSGTIEAFGGDLSIYTGVLKNQRESYTTDVNGNVLTNSGAASIMAGGNMTLRANSIHNSISMIAADGDLDMQGGNLRNEAYIFGNETREEYYESLGGSYIRCYDSGYCNVRDYSGAFMQGMMYALIEYYSHERSDWEDSPDSFLDILYYDGDQFLLTESARLFTTDPLRSDPTYEDFFNRYLAGKNGGSECGWYIEVCNWNKHPGNLPDPNSSTWIPPEVLRPYWHHLGFFFPDKIWLDSFETVASTIQAGGNLTGNFTGTLENVNLHRKLDGSVSETRNAFVLADHSNVSNAATHDRQNADVNASGRDLTDAPTNTAPSIDTSINTNVSVENINNTTDKNIISGAGGKSLDRSLESVDQIASNNGAAAIDSSRENVNNATSQAGAGTVTGNKTTVENADGSNESVALDSTGPGNVPSVPAGGTTLTPITNPTPDANPIVISYNPAQNLELPTNKGMFVVNADPKSQYLVETNPLLTNYLDFIGTDYLLDRLGFDPADLKRRLGDAFYETRLLRDGIFETFGQRYLTDQNTGLAFTSDEAQFRYLMDNAIAANEALHLSVGVELSAEQVARLTHDIVWLVEQEVNGEKVLVPMYYASAARAGDLDNKGALIAGQSVNLSADQGITNTGNLRGVHDLTLRTQQALRNTGNISAENFVILDAGSITNTRDKIGNSGSIVSGREGSLTLIARSGDINNDSRIAGGDVRLESEIGSITNSGSLNAQRDLVAIAQRDIINTVVTDNTGERVGSIESGRNLSLITREGDISNRATITTDSAHGHTTRVTVGTAPRINAGGDMTLDSGRDVLLTASNLRSGNDMTLNAARDIRVENAANESHFVGQDYNGKTNQSSRVEHVGSSLDAGGDMTMNAGRDAHLLGTDVTAQGNVALNAERDLNLEAVADSSHSETHRKRYDRVDSTVTHVQTTITAGADASLKAGQDINMIGSTLTAQGDASLHAERDTNLVAVNDSEYHYEYEKKKKSFGRSTTTVTETLKENVVGGVIDAGGDVLINTRKSGDTLITENSGNVNIVGGIVRGGKDVVIAADEDINITGAAYNELDFHSKSKSGFGGLSKKSAGEVADNMKLAASVISATAGSASLVSGNNLSLVGADVMAGGDINLEAVDQLLVNAGEVVSQSESWSKKSGLFSGGDLYSSSERKAGESVTGAQASTVTAGGNVNINAGRAKVIGSDIHGETGVDINTDIGDLEVLAARTTTETYAYEKDMTVGLGDLVEGLSRPDQLVKNEDGRATIKLADATYDEVDTKTQTVEHRGSTVTSGGNVNLTSTENILVEGSHIAADVNNAGEGDVNFAAGNNVTIKEATDSYDSDSKEIHGTAELSVVVQHQAVEVAKAVIAVDDAKDQLEQAKKDYKKYEKDLDNLQSTLSALETDYANKTPGVSYEDILELRELVGDVKGDKEWYVAGVALAAANLTAKTTALVQQTAAAAQSTATWGFNAGLQLDIEASKTTTSIKETTAVASTVSGNNINIQTGAGKDSAEGTATNIGGSHLQADNSLAINTGELNITASKNTQEIDSNTEQGHITAQMTVYGAAAGGVSVNADFSRSKNSETHTTINNSTLSADNIQLTTTGDTNIRGGNVHANSALVADIGGDLNVESLQNRSRTKNNSAGISGGLSASGGNTTGVNGGINASNGMSTTRETVRSSLTSGGTADIIVAGNTQITAATIATIDEDGKDLGNLNLSTGSLSFTDLRDTDQSNQTSGGISTSLNVGGSTATENSQNQQLATDSQGRELDPSTSNITYSNNSQYDASKALATLGNGNVTIGGKADSEENPHESLAGLNRDTTNTTKDLWSVERQEGNVDLAIDHRMLSEEGRKEIADQAKVVYEQGGEALKRTQYIIQSLGTNLDGSMQDALRKSGEKAVNSLMRNGLSETEANQFLRENPDIISVIAQLQIVRDAVDNPQVFALEQQGEQLQNEVEARLTQQLMNHFNPDGQEYIVIGVAPSATPVETAGMALGDGKRYIDDLRETNPTAARLAEIAISGALGGGVKSLIMVPVSQGVDAVVNELAGEHIQNATDYVTNHVGKVITRDDESYDEFAELAGGGTYEDRQGRIKDGAEFILGTVLGVIGAGKGDDSGAAVGVKGNGDSASTANIRSADEAKNAGKDAGDSPQANSNHVDEGETGTYGKLAPRSIGDGLTPDHIPSYASVRRAIDDADIELSDDQLKVLRNNTNCVVVKTCDHQTFSRTYGGRNSQGQINADSNDLYRAAQADLDTWESVWREKGWTESQIRQTRTEVHELNRKLFGDLGIKYEP